MPVIGSDEPVRVIVTDPHIEKHGLAVVRSLGRRGIYVTCVYKREDFEEHGRIGAALSRYCRELVVTDDLLGDILRLADRHAVLIPIANSTVDTVARNLDMLQQHILVPMPDYETLCRARDKRALHALCEEAGVPVPTVYRVVGPADAARATGAVQFPAVVKFRDEMVQTYPRWVRVNDQAGFEKAYDSMHAMQPHPLVQECLPGRGKGFFALCAPGGEPRSVFCHERLREYPPEGGQSTLCRSIHDERLIEYGTRVLRALGWVGVAMVEFKLDADGEPRVLEVNPRFWGSLPLAVLSGVDFPWLLVQLALDGEVEPMTDYRVGLRMRYLSLDIRSVGRALRSRRSGRARLLGRFLLDLLDLRIREGQMAIDDLRPLLSIWGRMVEHLLKSPTRARRKRPG